MQQHRAPTVVAWPLQLINVISLFDDAVPCSLIESTTSHMLHHCHDGPGALASLFPKATQVKRKFMKVQTLTGLTHICLSSVSITPAPTFPWLSFFSALEVSACLTSAPLLKNYRPLFLCLFGSSV